MPRQTLGDLTVHECKGHRQKARSVAWNSTGGRLASASTDKTAKIWSVEGSGQAREICTLNRHEAAVQRVRWHPKDPFILCTAADDRAVLLWDVRSPSSSSSRIISKIDLISLPKNGMCPASVEWHPEGRSLAVAEKDNCVHVYDVRKILHGRSKPARYNSVSNSASIGKPARTYRLRPDVVQECHFSPGGGHLVAATKGADGMGTVRIWQHDKPVVAQPNSNSTNNTASINKRPPTVLVGHTGPIFCLRFSPCGSRLATGGADALVGLWSTSDMICTSTIGRLNKFVRSVSFSYDSRLLASSSEENFIDIADAETGEKVGNIPARHGADEMAWNPKQYALAFASGDAPEGAMSARDRGVPCVAVVNVKLNDR